MTAELTITILVYHLTPYVSIFRSLAEEHRLTGYPGSNKWNTMYTDDRISEIVSSWDLKFRRSRPEIDIAGSPERTAYRMVIEDEGSALWVLEAIPPASREHKARISQALAFLRERGLRTVHPHLVSADNERLVRHGEFHWQVRPYVGGVPLPRPSYVLDRWRGKACADFLADMREKARDMAALDRREAFSMFGFIDEMSGTMERYDPGVRSRMGPAFGFIEGEFARLEGGLPTRFCHGDFHPLNVIWSGNGIESVIDWEFLGPKPEVYDLANLIGCVGFEDPAALNKGFVMEFISQVREAAAVSDLCWEILPEWVVAMRFAWLSDWLLRGDEEMVNLEVAYIELLIDNRKGLKEIWDQTR